MSKSERRAGAVGPSWRVRVGMAGLLLALGACTTQTVSRQSTTPDRDTRGNAEQPDPERLARTRLELAGLYLSRGQTDTALDETRRALAAKPDLPEAYGLRGLIFSAMNDVPKAEEAFAQALRLAPRDGDVRHNHAWFLCQQKRYAEADAQFTEALKQPGYRDVSRTLLAQGVCAARDSRWLQAEAALGKAFELEPGNPLVAYNLADVLLRRGDYTRARFYAARINAVPELVSAQSLWLAARIEHAMGNARETQDFGRRLQERFPQSEEARRFEGGRYDG